MLPRPPLMPQRHIPLQPQPPPQPPQFHSVYELGELGGAVPPPQQYPPAATSTPPVHQRSAVQTPDFVIKLYKMLFDPQASRSVAWSPTGDSFIVFDPSEFAKSCLPCHFRHRNFASFVRQLNKYDFHKKNRRSLAKIAKDRGSVHCSAIVDYGPEAWEFHHPSFKYGQVQLLAEIKRKPPAKVLTDVLDGSLGAEAVPIHAMRDEAQADHSSVYPTSHLPPLNVQGGTLPSAPHSSVALNHEERPLASASDVDYRDPASSQTLIRCMQAQITQLQRDHLDASSRADNLQKDCTSLRSDLESCKQREAEKEVWLSQITERLRSLELRASQPQPTTLYQTNSEFTIAQQRDITSPPPRPVSLYQEQHDAPKAPQDAFIVPANPCSAQSSGQSASNNTHGGTVAKYAQSHALFWIRPPRILLVEDDAVCLGLSARLLQLFGCRLDMAMDGLSAVEKLGQNRYDLVLMDVGLPGIDGVQATSKIREFDPSTPIVTLTGRTTARECLTYLATGMNDILAKPFRKEMLWEMLEKHCRHLEVGVASSVSDAADTDTMMSRDDRESTGAVASLDADMPWRAWLTVESSAVAAKNGTGMASTARFVGSESEVLHGARVVPNFNENPIDVSIIQQSLLDDAAEIGRRGTKRARV